MKTWPAARARLVRDEAGAANDYAWSIDSPHASQQRLQFAATGRSTAANSNWRRPARDPSATFIALNWLP
jgi:hypothetical protein